jgi:rhodanese-related sulfurtransferase
VFSVFDPSLTALSEVVRGKQAVATSPASVTPEHAWSLVQHGKAVLVDVRTVEERKFVGFAPRSVHVAWATGIDMVRNPHFVRDLEAKVRKTDVVLLLCRSGKRSAAAAQVAAEAGFERVYNVLEGFEGDLDDDSRRGTFEGWRYRGLPWVQE